MRSIHVMNAFAFRCTLMILHLSRMSRNVTRILFNARTNVSATPLLQRHSVTPMITSENEMEIRVLVINQFPVCKSNDE